MPFDPKSIEAFRRRLGLSQYRLAALLKVPTSTVHRWEARKSMPSAALLGRLYDLGRRCGIQTRFFSESSDQDRVPESSSSERVEANMTTKAEPALIKIEKLPIMGGKMILHIRVLAVDGMPATDVVVRITDPMSPERYQDLSPTDNRGVCQYQTKFSMNESRLVRASIVGSAIETRVSIP